MYSPYTDIKTQIHHIKKKQMNRGEREGSEIKSTGDSQASLSPDPGIQCCFLFFISASHTRDKQKIIQAKYPNIGNKIKMKKIF